MQLSVNTDAGGKRLQLPPEPDSLNQTPPVTPSIEDAPPDDSNLGFPSSSDSASRKPITLASWDSKTPLEFHDELVFRKDPAGRLVELGRGAWSTVYMAALRESTHTPLITPPSSPASGSQVIAVKSPSRRDAHPILHAEALALTRLSLTRGSETHIVPFHGYIENSNSIVMSAVPLSLCSYIEEKAILVQRNLSTKTMFDPVLGTGQWRDLAKKLIQGLWWMHSEARVVHGDIKPHNVLLRPSSTTGSGELDTTFPYEPLFVDFSSALDMACPSTTQENKGTSLTALTPPFAAPELLLLSSTSTPNEEVPTVPSDVFSLAISLISAATGDLLLYPGASKMQRLAMAREGHRVLEFVRSGSNGCRVPRGGAVEQIVMPAILKDPAQRIVGDAWVRLVEGLV